MTTWSFDPDTRDYVARLLWDHLPAFYRVQDQAPRGEDELRLFLAVLGAPLALLRQNIEELHANLFIDTCGAEAIPRLAALVGTTTLFPDAETNRRDVRGTVAWRRRKGTPAMLEQMAGELADELVVLQEGWKHVQLAQDLDLLRLDRVAAKLVPAIVAETSSGPLDRMHHAIDVRSISATTGRYHPKHVAFWRHPTTTWPLQEGTAYYRGNHVEPITTITLAGVDPDPDWRYAIHPLGRRWALRARSVDDDDRLASDRIPAMHFASDPSAWFEQPGRFGVRICSLPAAITSQEREVRSASELPAELSLVEGSVSLRVLERASERWIHPVEVALCSARIDGGTLLPDTSTIDPPDGPAAATKVRSSIVFDGGSVQAPVVSNSGPVPADSVVLVRLRPVGAGACFMPGATLAIEGGEPSRVLASSHAELALRGYLRGALFVELPPLWVFGERWFYLAGDGSLIACQTSGSGALDVPLIDAGAGEYTLDLDQLVHTGLPAAWPPQAISRSSDRITRIPASPGRGPQILHGGRVFTDALAEIDVAAECALELGVRHTDAGNVLYEPMVRLRWTGSDPASATWEALDQAGVATADVDARFAELAVWRDTGPNGLRLSVRFVCDVEAARMAPAELAWSAHDGRTTLIYLPEQQALASEALDDWPSEPTYTAFSSVVEPAEDGSCWAAGAGLARVAEGQIAPLDVHGVHQRRRVRWRKLCPWDNESGSDKLAGTEPGWLDVDVEHGLFALALDEPPQRWPSGPVSAPIPPNVSVAFEDAYSDHVGARPASREIELARDDEGQTTGQRLATPTRLVTRSGVLSQVNDAELSALPRYASLKEALGAIAADPNPAAHEVVQFEDDATYPSEAPTWPTNVTSLTIQAAEDHRPVIRLTSFTLPPALAYESLALIGLSWLGADLVLPRCELVELLWCSVLEFADSMTFDLATDGQARVDHCITGGLTLSGTGTLTIFDSAIDAGKDEGLPALTSAEGRIELERCTVIGSCSMRELEASETLFVDPVVVADRFRGCIRYSAVPEGCTLPRRHRVVEGETPRFVSVDRHHPAHLRLTPACSPRIRQGGEDGGEIGLFHDLQAQARREALLRRIDEYTPTGLLTGLIRID